MTESMDSWIDFARWDFLQQRPQISLVARVCPLKLGGHRPVETGFGLVP
jgi:hypothetical protein